MCYDVPDNYVDPLGLNAALAHAADNALAALEQVTLSTAEHRSVGKHPREDFGGNGYFRDLTDEELSLASSDETIIVTGTRLVSTYNTMNLLMWSVDGGDYNGGSSSQPEPPCWWGMSEQEKVDSLIDEEAAKILQEILAQADQKMEYGSVIYIDANGNIQHSPLRPSSDFTTRLDFSMVPLGADGTTDFSRVIAVVHSHPQWLPNEDGSAGYTNYFRPSDPDFLLYPSDRSDIQDDWDYYDWITNQILNDGGDPSQFSMYIAGFNGSTLELNQYFGDDKHTTTVDSGDHVDANYESPLNSGC